MTILGCCNECITWDVDFDVTAEWKARFDFDGAVEPLDGLLKSGEKFVSKSKMPSGNYDVLVSFAPVTALDDHKIAIRLVDDTPTVQREVINAFGSPTLAFAAAPTYIKKRFPNFGADFEQSYDVNFGAVARDFWAVTTNRAEEVLLGVQDDYAYTDSTYPGGAVPVVFEAGEFLAKGGIFLPMDNTTIGECFLEIENLSANDLQIGLVTFNTRGFAACPAPARCSNIATGEQLRLLAEVDFGDATTIPDQPLLADGCSAKTVIHYGFIDGEVDPDDHYLDEDVTSPGSEQILDLQIKVLPTSGYVSLSTHKLPGVSDDIIDCQLESDFVNDFSFVESAATNIGWYKRSIECALESESSTTKRLRVTVYVEWAAVSQTSIDAIDRDWEFVQRFFGSTNANLPYFGTNSSSVTTTPAAGGRSVDRCFGYSQTANVRRAPGIATTPHNYLNTARRKLKIEWLLTGLSGIDSVDDLGTIALHSDTATIEDVGALIDGVPKPSDGRVHESFTASGSIVTTKIDDDDGSMVCVTGNPGNPFDNDRGYANDVNYEFEAVVSVSLAETLKNVLPVVVTLNPAA